MANKRTITVFIASPGDLAVERRAFRNCISELNEGFGDGANVQFEPLGWEDTLASTGRRNQGVINTEIDRCDIFILAMHRRWGQEAPDAKPYLSYTEEEFHRAMERWNQQGHPEIFVFFKYVDAPSMADPGPQLSKVLDFRRQLEETRHILYHEFVDEHQFVSNVSRHLRAFAKNELPRADKERHIVVLPVGSIREVEDAKQQARQEAERAELANQRADAAAARADELALVLAEQAASAALDGRVEEARQTFAKSTDGTTNLEVLQLACGFYSRTGDLVPARQMCERRLAISGHDAETAATASAYGDLGLVYEKAGELDQAQAMYKKAMAIDEQLGNREGIARHSSNLGVIYRSRCEFERAELALQKALSIYEELNHREGTGNAYGNLGLIYLSRAEEPHILRLTPEDTLHELDRAEEMLQKALSISKEFNQQEGMANAYGNLGVVFQMRENLDAAEDMHHKALAIDEKLGRQEGMAAAYGNLGLIFEKRNETQRSEEMHKRALAIDERLGRSDAMAADYGNLGVIYRMRGELERATAMHQESLAVYKNLNRHDGMAKQLGCLGVIYQQCGELERAEEMHQQALDIDERFSNHEGIARHSSNLGSVAADRGDLRLAQEHWIKARDLYSEIKMRPHADRVQRYLDRHT